MASKVFLYNLSVYKMFVSKLLLKAALVSFSSKVEFTVSSYLHMHKHVRVRMMITIAATDAPMATATTSPSSSH